MNTIKTAICSFGMSGQVFHAPFIHAHPNFDLNAIVERHKEDSKALYPQAKLYTSVEAMLADESIELVVVNTPIQTHFDYTRQALLAGKHVVVEKPFTVSAEQAKELIRIAEATNKLLTVYQNRRYDSDFLAVKKIIEGGSIGSVKEFQIRFDRFRPGISTKAHKENVLPGAGTLYDLGAHLIDQALVLFGWPNALFADDMAMREGSKVDDYFEVLLYYPTLRVRLISSSFALADNYAYVLHGTQGSYLQQRSDSQEKQLLKGIIPSLYNWIEPTTIPNAKLIIPNTAGEPQEELQIHQAGNYMNFYSDLSRALKGEGENPVLASQGLQTIQIIEAAKKSISEKKVINLIA